MVGSGGDSWTAEAEAAPSLAPGARLGKYEIRRLLGAGGMGSVYEAHHTEIGKRVAIKVLAPELAVIPGARTRFLREAQLASKINHPNIVDVNDMGNENGQAFIVMEFLDGEDLSRRLERTGPMVADQLVDIMLPVCSGVAEAHRNGITHRDLKPQNIFLANGPRGIEPKVLDFGISKANDTKAGVLTGTGMIGTPFYFAPEQILDSHSAGPASDQYALGVILYECLSGRRPYEAAALFLVFQAIVDANAPPVGTLRPDLPLPLQQIIARAMHKAPTARFASAAELGRALLPFASARARSAWEHAFTDSGRPGGGTTLIAEHAGGTPAPGRAVPATTPMPRAPLAASVTPVSSGGTMELPTTGPGRPTPVFDAGFPVDLRPRRRKGPILAVVGVLAVAGIAAAFTLGGPARTGAVGKSGGSGAEEAPAAAAFRPSSPPPEPRGVEPPVAPVADERPAAPPAPKLEAPPAPSRAVIRPPAPARKREAVRPHRERAPADSPRILNPNAAPILE